MIVLAGLAFGAFLGYFRARKLGGNGFDTTQYMLVHALIFGVIGMFLTIIVSRAV